MTVLIGDKILDIVSFIITINITVIIFKVVSMNEAQKGA